MQVWSEWKNSERESIPKEIQSRASFWGHEDDDIIDTAIDEGAALPCILCFSVDCNKMDCMKSLCMEHAYISEIIPDRLLCMSKKF